MFFDMKTKYMRRTHTLKSISVEKKSFFYLLLFLPYIEPQIFKEDKFIAFDKLYLMLKAVSFLIILFLYVTSKKAPFLKLILAMGGVQIATFIGTFLNKGSYTTFLGPAINSIAVLMLCQLAMTNNFKLFLIYVEKTLYVYIFLHLCMLFLRISGIYLFGLQKSTFLGIENRWIYVLLPLSIIASVNSYLNHNNLKFKAIVIIAISFFSVLYAWSAGAMVAFVVFIGLLLIFSRVKKVRFPILGIEIVFLILNYLLVNEIILKGLSNILKVYLKKDITLSGRVYLWREVIRTLNEKPWFGKGVQSAVEEARNFFIKSNFIPGCAVNHPHNHLLYILYNGGFIALFFFLLFVFISTFYLRNLKSQKVKGVLIAGMISIFAAALVDTLDYSLFYLVALIPIGLEKYEIKNRNLKIKLTQTTS